MNKAKNERDKSQVSIPYKSKKLDEVLSDSDIQKLDKMLKLKLHASYKSELAETTQQLQEKYISKYNKVKNGIISLYENELKILNLEGKHGRHSNTIHQEKTCNCVYEGILFKYSNIIDEWQKFMFVLSSTTGLLSYYKVVKQEKKLRGALHLEGAVIIEKDETIIIGSISGEILKLKVGTRPAFYPMSLHAMPVQDCPAFITGWAKMQIMWARPENSCLCTFLSQNSEWSNQLETSTPVDQKLWIEQLRAVIDILPLEE